MTNRRRSRLGDDRGAVAVEFALVLIPLMLIISGIIDFGRVYNAQETLTQAARVGARQASLGKSTATVQQDVRDAATSLDVPASSVHVANHCGTTNEAIVTVDYDVDFWMLSAFLPSHVSHVSVQGKATAPC
jgi:Flp pilus assembly protein TadG